MAQESPVEVLKLRFARGEITHEQYKEMLAVLLPSEASREIPATPPKSSAALDPLPAASPPSYKGMVYIPPVSESTQAAAKRDYSKFTPQEQRFVGGLAIVVGILGVSVGSELSGLVIGFGIVFLIWSWRTGRKTP